MLWFLGPSRCLPKIALFNWNKMAGGVPAAFWSPALPRVPAVFQSRSHFHVLHTFLPHPSPPTLQSSSPAVNQRHCFLPLGSVPSQTSSLQVISPRCPNSHEYEEHAHRVVRCSVCFDPDHRSFNLCAASIIIIRQKKL